MSEVMSSLLWLYNNGYLDINQYNILSNFYKNDTRDISVIRSELRGFYENRNNIVSKIASINSQDIEVIDVFDLDNSDDSVSDDTFELDDISSDNYFISDVADFVVDNNNFIGLDFFNDDFKVFHNELDLPGEILYNRLLNKMSNDRSKATSSFVKMLGDSSEVKFYNFSHFLNTNVYNELPDVFKNCINVVKSSYSNKNIICSPIDNIYIVDDELIHVVNNNGVYQALPVEYINGSSSEFVEVQSNSESLSNVKGIGGNTKALGTNPIFGGIKWSKDENGFMNILYSVFIVGICVGMIFMVFFNLFVR